MLPSTYILYGVGNASFYILHSIWLARSTRLVILIKGIYTLWGRKCFLLPYTLWGRKRFLLQLALRKKLRNLHGKSQYLLVGVALYWNKLALSEAQESARNLRCVRSSGICTLNLNSLEAQESERQISIAFSYSFRDLSVHPDGQTDGQMDMARSTRLVILRLYILYGVGNASFYHILYGVGNASFCNLRCARSSGICMANPNTCAA